MVELFAIWLRSWKPIAIFCMAAIVLSIIISMPAIMPPYYMSRVIFYPSNPASSDRNTLFNEDGRSMDYFGGKSDADRLLSIANSQPLAEAMIHKFDLKRHYGIKDGMYNVRREFAGNYKTIKNNFSALEVIVYDKDPQFAATLAKAIVKYIDSTNLAMINTTRLRNTKAFEMAFKQKEAELQSVSDSLSRIKSRHNIIMSTEGIIVSGNNAHAVERATILQGRQGSLITELTQISRIKHQNEMVAADNSSTIFILEDAAPAERKSKPVRWMIVLGTAIASFAAATVFAIALELVQRERSKA